MWVLECKCTHVCRVFTMHVQSSFCRFAGITQYCIFLAAIGLTGVLLSWHTKHIYLCTWLSDKQHRHYRGLAQHVPHNSITVTSEYCNGLNSPFIVWHCAMTVAVIRWCVSKYFEQEFPFSRIQKTIELAVITKLSRWC